MCDAEECDLRQLLHIQTQGGQVKQRGATAASNHHELTQQMQTMQTQFPKSMHPAHLAPETG